LTTTQPCIKQLPTGTLTLILLQKPTVLHPSLLLFALPVRRSDSTVQPPSSFLSTNASKKGKEANKNATVQIRAKKQDRNKVEKQVRNEVRRATLNIEDEVKTV